MTINQLRYFVTVCNCMKIRTAANILHISEPSLSVSIKNLEAELGFALFVRNKKEMILTDEGNMLYARAKVILDDFDKLEADMKNLHKSIAPVRIGIPHLVGAFHFSSLISDYSKAHPQIQFDITSASSVDSVSMLKNRELDIIISNKQPMKDMDNIDFWPIINTNLIGCVKKGHPLAGKKDVTISMMKDEKLVFISQKSVIAKTIIQKYQEAGYSPNLFMYSNSMDLALDMVKNHSAITFFLGEYLHNNNLSDENMKALDFFEFKDNYTFSVGVAINSENSIPEAVSFFEYCKHTFLSPDLEE